MAEITTKQRYKLEICYIGTNYYGWQKQQNLPSIQAEIEQAIKSFSNQEVIVTAAGRTDSGVHAEHQVIHFDLDISARIYKAKEVHSALSHFLKGKQIGVLGCMIAHHDFHARFSAKSRSYIYRITNSQSIFDQGRKWQIKEQLDHIKLEQEALKLIGTYDFTSFRSKHCQAKSPIKTVNNIFVQNNIKSGIQNIEIQITAPSFLHNQVRIIIGTLYQISTGYVKDDILSIINAKHRNSAPFTAPSCGLYLSAVTY